MATRTQVGLTSPSESVEQQCLFRWAALQSGKYPELAMMYHIPNGGSRGKVEAIRFKAEGVKAGVPDICLPVPRGTWHGLYIELKRREGGQGIARTDEMAGRADAAGILHGDLPGLGGRTARHPRIPERERRG